MWELLKLFLSEMTPRTKRGIDRGVNITTRGIVVLFIGYLFFSYQSQKAEREHFQSTLNGLTLEIHDMNLKLQSANDYRIADVKEHSQMQLYISENREDLSEVRGYLGMRVRGVK